MESEPALGPKRPAPVHLEGTRTTWQKTKQKQKQKQNKNMALDAVA